MLTQEQTDFALDCYKKYCYIREDNGLGLPSAVDIDHSSLLRRSELWEHEDCVIIDQSRAWTWIDKTQGILLHKNGDKYKFTSVPEPDHHILGILQKMEETCPK